jgi:predicted methyltransferase
MKVAIMQPYVFPYIGYFQLINAVDKFVILDDVNFIMRGWINRNRILVNGNDYLFSVPIIKASQNKLIFECELAEGNWNEKLLKTIELNYKKAPFFEDCFETISAILNLKEKNLSKWLSFQIRIICNYLNIKTDIVDTSRIYSNQHLKAQDKIIDICKQEGADTYYNAIGGKLLYNFDDFRKNNIEIHFLNTLSEKYSQFKNDFVPFLSIIDVMMFNDVNKIQNQLTKYELL